MQIQETLWIKCTVFGESWQDPNLSYSKTIGMAIECIGMAIECRGMNSCDACSIEKAKQVWLVKKCKSSTKATMSGERLFSDLTIITTPEHLDIALGKTVWHMTADQYTGFIVLAFYSRKNKYLELFCKSLLEWISQGLGIKYINYDDASKNNVFIKFANEPSWNIHLVPELVFRSRYTS